MARAFIYDKLMKLVSGVVLTAIVVAVVVETDLLPPKIRHPMRSAFHSAGEKVTRLPGVAQILKAFRS
jgi:hypothetical protein